MRRIATQANALFIGLSLAVAVLAIPRVADAQQCITSPVSLPQLNGNAPIWLDPSSTALTWRAELQDPRWSGAPLFNLCDNPNLNLCAFGTHQAQFRALLDGTDLYVAFHNLVDDDMAGDDAVFIAIKSSGVTSARMAKILLNNGGTPISPTPPVTDAIAPIVNSGATINWSQASNANGAAAWDSLTLDYPPAISPATESWLQDVASWTNSPGVQWGITFKIDLTQFGYSAPITADIPIFFGSRHTPSMGAAMPLPNVTTDTVGAGETIVPGNSAAWMTFTPPAAGCPGGVTLSPSNIGVGAALGGEVGICPGSTDCPGRQHTFRGEAQNVPAAASVQARMRLANFGSVPTDWENSDWHDIPLAGNPLVDNPIAAGWNFPGESGGVAIVEHQCTIESGQDYCPVLSGVEATTPQQDQCLFVELGAPEGSNLTFASKAAYKNIWFHTLSTLSKTAEINIKGLQKTTNKKVDRDIYLYVQTENMPEHGEQPLLLPRKTMELVKAYARRPPARPRYVDPKGIRNELAAGNQDKSKYRAGPITHTEFARRGQVSAAQNPLVVPTLSDDQALGLVWPTYKVHVYYDSERTVVTGGVERKVLVPMVPFGYYMDHDGPYYGFTHAIHGVDGVELEPIAPNWYKFRLENEGKAKVRTVISAEEKPRSAKHCPDCCEPSPPPKVVIQPRCYCRTAGQPSGSGVAYGLGSVFALGLLVGARRRARP